MKTYQLDIIYKRVAVVTSLLFSSSRKAESARKKLAQEMAKGEYRNDNCVVDIIHMSGTASIMATELVSVCVHNPESYQDFNQQLDERRAAKQGVAGNDQQP